MDALQTPQKYLKNPKPVPPFLFPYWHYHPLVNHARNLEINFISSFFLTLHI